MDTVFITKGSLNLSVTVVGIAGLLGVGGSGGVDVDVGGGKRKIAFFMWAPEVANVKSKMVYAASKDALRKKLDGIAKEIQANDAADLVYADVKTALLNVA